MPERGRRGNSLGVSIVGQAVYSERSACARVAAAATSAAASAWALASRAFGAAATTDVDAGTCCPARVEPLESRTLLSTSWFVAPNGSDGNSGGIDSPFRTIQHAANIATAGDTVEIRAGVYHEDVVPQHSGTSGAPIIFEAYHGESVTVTGADPVTGWSNYQNSIYRAPVGWDLGEGNNQVFVDGTMMNEARWPNTSLDPSHPSLEQAQGVSINGSYATLYDSNLNQPSGYWVGATIHIAPGQAWTAQTGTVVSSSQGQLTYSFEPLDRYELPKAGNSYYLTGTFKALYAPAQWYLGGSSLYLWTPRGDSPANHDIEVKHRDYAFDVSGQSYIRIQNVNIFAATINSDSNSTGLVVNQINARYTGQFLETADGWHLPQNTGLVIAGAYSTVSNSVIAYSAGDGILVKGSGSRITNNVIHDIDYSGTDTAPIRAYGNNISIDHNTIYNAGRSGILHKGSGLKIMYNTITALGLQTTEAGGIYTVGSDGGGSEIAYNKVYGFHSGGFGQTALFFDNTSSNYYVHDNVVSDVDNALKMNGYSRGFIIRNNWLSGSWYSTMGDLHGDWYGTTLTNNVFQGTSQIGSGASVSNNPSYATGGAGPADFTSGASGTPVTINDAAPPPVSGGYVPPSSGGSAAAQGSSSGSTPPPSSGGSSSSGNSSNSNNNSSNNNSAGSSSGAAASSGTGSSSSVNPGSSSNTGTSAGSSHSSSNAFVGPLPPMGPLSPSELAALGGSSNSASPSTEAGWTALVQADRKAIVAVQQQQAQHVQDLNNTLHTDLTAYQVAVQQLRAAPRDKGQQSAAVSSQIAGAAATSSPRSTLSERAQQLLTTIRADRTAITDARKAAVDALVAARQKLAADIKSMHSALRKLPSKKA